MFKAEGGAKPFGQLLRVSRKKKKNTKQFGNSADSPALLMKNPDRLHAWSQVPVPGDGETDTQEAGGDRGNWKDDAGRDSVQSDGSVIL